MALLGIDFGKKRVGLALSESGLQAEPLQILSYTDKHTLFEELSKIITTNAIETVVVGIPQKDVIGARTFGDQLTKSLNIPVTFVSEDLTSWQADQLRKKVKLTDDLAAVLILQEFLDNR